MRSIRIDIASRQGMAAFAADLALLLQAGDVLVLTGNLGAGKTTFTQFLSRALDVRGRVSSPTFTIAREHPARGAGPGLVHVDAYRLTSADEFDDLGLDASLEESVTVVEWGRGMAESLGDHLDVEILRTGALGEADAQVVGADRALPEAGTDGGDDAGEGEETGDVGAGTEGAGRSGEDADDESEDEVRTVLISAVGPSWCERLAGLRGLARQEEE